MQRKNVQTIVLDTITGFMPAAFLTMILILAVDQGFTPRIHSGLLLLELTLLASGFVPIALFICSKRSIPQRWHIVMSGVGAVLLLGVLSAFLQGVGIGTIIVASVLAGMFSALGTLARSRIQA